MNKKEFIKKYKTLSEQDKRTVKKYHEDMLKNAIFLDTFNIAERTLLWIHELEQE